MNRLLTYSKVIIDHSTAAGFEAVAEARAYLLKMGQQEFDDPEAASWNIRGAHVVAPVSPQQSHHIFYCLNLHPSAHTIKHARYTVETALA